MSLEQIIEQVSHRMGDSNPIEGLQILTRATPGPLQASIYEPVLCVILQGAKEVAIAEQSLSFGPGECLLVSHDLPVTSRITEAPYLALVFHVDVATVRTLHDQVAASEGDDESAQSAEVHRAEPELLDAIGRYLALADAPSDAAVLGPLVAKEIHYRLLTAPYGAMLRNLVRRDSHASAIARAIEHIRRGIRTPIVVPDLARRVGMSASSFHKYFKKITSTTPLQYQKELRLLEARRLLTTRGTSVTAAAYGVGYESASQFSREYARKFGVPPSQDLAVRD